MLGTVFGVLIMLPLKLYYNIVFEVLIENKMNAKEQYKYALVFFNAFIKLVGQSTIDKKDIVNCTAGSI